MTPAVDKKMAMMTSSVVITCNMERLAAQVRRTTEQIKELSVVIERNCEHWHCTLSGDWPDKFTLLNRYVRTGVEPEYIFND